MNTVADPGFPRGELCLLPTDDTMKFFLNVSLNFSETIFVITIKGLKTCLCKRPGYVRDRIAKLSLIHASVIYQIP